MNGPFDRKRASGVPATSAPSSPSGRTAPGTSSVSVSRSEEDDARSSSKYRAALEALFAPKQAAAPSELPAAPEKSAKKMVAVPTRDDPRGPEREKRLGKLLGAEGRSAVTKAAKDFLGQASSSPRSKR